MSMCQPCKDAADTPNLPDLGLSPGHDDPLDSRPPVRAPHACAFPASCTCQHKGAGLVAQDPGKHVITPGEGAQGYYCCECRRNIKATPAGWVHFRQRRDFTATGD
jgi:hypothetical protein